MRKSAAAQYQSQIKVQTTFMDSTMTSSYRLVSDEFIQDIQSRGRVLIHSRSGARIVVLENDDDNKTFSVSFKTIPDADDGLAHIMEHAVFCGSRKFKVKEPFVSLMKSSLNTFLNAFTCSDKTVYPVASRNHADFFNLVDVYMDTVLFPSLEHKSFLQEGWHYQVDNEGKLDYNGVVFNEMKGAYSDTDTHLERQINLSLFPESVYRFDSGGFPEAITDLSYEKYLRFHKDKYHPSNAVIVLYGDMDSEKILSFLDEEYLSHFDKIDVSQAPELQPRFSTPVIHKATYPLAEDDKPENKTHISLNFLLGQMNDAQHYFEGLVLDYLLVGSPSAVLSSALRASGLGEDIIDDGFEHGNFETTYSVGIRNTSAEKADAVRELIFKTIARIVEEGFSSKALEAALNTMNFYFREANYGSFPKGLAYSLPIADAFFYGTETFAFLRHEDIMADLEKKASQGYFEKLVKKYFLENSHYSTVILEPDCAQNEREDKKETVKLSQYAESLTAKDINLLRQTHRELLAHQNSTDSSEVLATMPKLSLDDISREGESIPSELIEVEGSPLYYHDLETNGVLYINFSFDADSLKDDELYLLPLLTSLYLEVGSDHFSYDQLSDEFACSTGGVGASWKNYSRPTESHLRMNFSVKVMENKVADLINLLQESFCHVHFRDEKRVAAMLRSAVARTENSLLTYGERTAAVELNAGLSKTGVVNARAAGLSALEKLRKFSRGDISEICRVLSEKSVQIINRANLLINLTCRQSQKEVLVSQLGRLLGSMRKDVFAPSIRNYELHTKNVGIMTSATVQYVGKGLNFYDYGYNYNGDFRLLNQFLSTDYLWDKVRVIGGAYGCHFHFDVQQGSLFLVSYRDPNLGQTIKVFDAIADYLENLEMAPEDIEQVLIGTFGSLDAAMTAQQKGELALTRFFSNLDDEFQAKVRRELFEADINSLRSYAGLFRQFAQNGRLCIQGSDSLLKKEAELFDELVSV